jgi:biopolymer transport protein ExbB
MLAVPAHLAYHFLSGRVRAIVRDIEWSANEIMKYLLTEYRSGGAGGSPATEPLRAETPALPGSVTASP